MNRGGDKLSDEDKDKLIAFLLEQLARERAERNVRDVDEYLKQLRDTISTPANLRSLTPTELKPFPYRRGRFPLV